MKSALIVLAAMALVTPLAWTRAADKPADPPAATKKKPAPDADRGDLSKPHNDPTDSYKVMRVEGWTIRVSKRYEGHDELLKELLDEVTDQLRRITFLVNEKPLAELRKVEIWFELGYPGRTQYHNGRKWLVDNGYNPDKTDTVEIADARGFLEWRTRPVNTLLHELSHAYHDRVLGFDEPRIKACWEKAKAGGKFDRVIRDHGHSDRHYGLTNPMEYFAEATEAYLWVNDYYPFVYGELREADPDMAKLLEDIWGKRR